MMLSHSQDNIIHACRRLPPPACAERDGQTHMEKKMTTCVIRAEVLNYVLVP